MLFAVQVQEAIKNTIVHAVHALFGVYFQGARCSFC